MYNEEFKIKHVYSPNGDPVVGYARFSAAVTIFCAIASVLLCRTVEYCILAAYGVHVLHVKESKLVNSGAHGRPSGEGKIMTGVAVFSRVAASVPKY